MILSSTALYIFATSHSRASEVARHLLFRVSPESQDNLFGTPLRSCCAPRIEDGQRGNET